MAREAGRERGPIGPPSPASGGREGLSQAVAVSPNAALIWLSSFEKSTGFGW